MDINARVKLELEVTIIGSWDDKCSIQQIHKQVVEQAIAKVRHAIQDKCPELYPKGDPEVTVLIYKGKSYV